MNIERRLWRSRLKYSAVTLQRGKFSQNYSQKTSHSSPAGVRYGVSLWIQHLIGFLPESLLSFMQYLTILDRVITVLDCIILAIPALWCLSHSKTGPKQYCGHTTYRSNEIIEPERRFLLQLGCRYSHCSDATRTARFFKSPSTPLCVQQLVKLTTKNHIDGFLCAELIGL